MKLLRRTALGISATLLLGWFWSFNSLANDWPMFATYEEYAQAFTEGDSTKRSGMDTWFLWTAGNQAFWGRGFPIATRGEVDLLRLLDARIIPRGSRFEELGTINDPSCVAPAEPDEHGFLLDDCKEPQTPKEKQVFGEPTGIVGLRKFPNPDFDPAYWAGAGGAEAYLAQTKETFDKKLEPPYLIGMSCAVCHVSFDPLNPPSEPADPNWENLAPAFGNRFLDSAAILLAKASRDEFRWHVRETQQPGTFDFSQIPNDFINNPATVNAIVGLSARLEIRTAEKISDAQATFILNQMREPAREQLILEPREPPKILTILNLVDGRSSMGLPLNTLRGYINMGGIVPLQFLRSIPSEANHYQQIPIGLEAAKANSSGLWQATEQRLPALKAFLSSLEPKPISQAPGGSEYLDDPPKLVERGKIIFARHCAQCHSSKHPDPSITDPEQLRLAYEQLVLSPDFLEDNFLSDDWRYPITEIQTNAARALVPNTTRGHIFEEFSSETYKQLSSAGQLKGLFNPLWPWDTLRFDLPAGGRGYYRTPSLISMWATAPYLHNDSLGEPKKDPSVSSRMEAFYKGVWKLLWPKARQGIRSIKRTKTASVLTDSLGNPVMVPRPQGDATPFIVPARTPVNLFANLHPLDLKKVVAAYAQRGIRAALSKALELNRSPDFIEDRGHYYGTELPIWDKWALITFLKRL